ncbi:MAG TPA: hypothetical protein H9761_18845 [Candidatus Eisenbergiella merdavium]|uniref:Uncharacterized protein n=1 Tax=Candidatus Eisenbergiella merdavium TaxID=2838551 RepID=A0A9D2SR57_9FIRM|nr:hypothetical protein [Candidatus Eisenbergiella merdavium]
MLYFITDTGADDRRPCEAVRLVCYPFLFSARPEAGLLLSFVCHNIAPGGGDVNTVLEPLLATAVRPTEELLSATKKWSKSELI